MRFKISREEVEAIRFPICTFSGVKVVYDFAKFVVRASEDFVKDHFLINSLF